jgi:hypothetical protein
MEIVTRLSSLREANALIVLSLHVVLSRALAQQLLLRILGLRMTCHCQYCAFVLSQDSQ